MDQNLTKLEKTVEEISFDLLRKDMLAAEIACTMLPLVSNCTPTNDLDEPVLRSRQLQKSFVEVRYVACTTLPLVANCMSLPGCRSMRAVHGNQFLSTGVIPPDGHSIDYVFGLKCLQ